MNVSHFMIAQQSLIDICDQISLAKLSPPQITFTGLSHFNNKVLYIDPVKDDHLDVLTRIAEICRETYEKNGIKSTDIRPFNPHLTLFKLSKARDLHKKGIRKIDEHWSTKYTDHHFGIENFQSIHLCSMLKKQKDGYYEIFHEQHLFNNGPNSFQLLNDEKEQVMEIDTSSIQTQENIIRTSDSQAIIAESTICVPTVDDETCPLLQRDPSTSEEAFTGFASPFRPSCCSCCSII